MTRDAPSTSSPELAVPGPTLRGVRLVIVSPDEAVLQRGLAEVRLVLPGLATILQRLSELADGTRDEERLVAAFPTDEQPQIQRLLIGLRSRGILHTVANPDPADLFWLSVARLAPDGAARLAASSVAVIAVGPVAEALPQALQSCGVGAVIGCASAAEAPAADVWCGASSDPVAAPTWLLESADTALRAGRVFLPVWLADLLIRVGPMTHPFDTSCLKCLLLRTDANDAQRDLHRLIRAEPGDGYSGSGFVPPLASIAGQVAAMEVVKYLAGLPVTTVGHAIELGLVPFRCDVRRVLRVPRCPLCSGIADRGAPVVAHASQVVD